MPKGKKRVSSSEYSDSYTSSESYSSDDSGISLPSFSSVVTKKRGLRKKSVFWKAFFEDSDLSSLSEEESGSENEDKVFQVLKHHHLCHLIKVFKRMRIDSLKKAAKLTDDKLESKLRIHSAYTRQKVLFAFQNHSSSESNEEFKIYQILSEAGASPLTQQKLQQAQIFSIPVFYSLTNNDLKDIGVPKKERMNILDEIGNRLSSTLKNSLHILVITEILENVKLEKYLPLFKKNAKMKTIIDMDHASLKKLGITPLSDRTTILNEFEKLSFKDFKFEKQKLNEISRFLKKHHFARFIESFKSFEVTDISEARELTHNKLRQMGIRKYDERKTLLNLFRKFKVRNTQVFESLEKAGLDKFASKFRHIESISHAKKLTHDDLKKIGISGTMDRDMILNAFRQF